MEHPSDVDPHEAVLARARDPDARTTRDLRLRVPRQKLEGGTVERVQSFGTYGLTVILAHGNGYRSLYMYLNEAKVSLGAKVAKGDIIGTVGGANIDEGSHLQFEIRGERGIPLDPTDWLKRRQ